MAKNDNNPHKVQWSYTESVIKEFCYLVKHFQENKEKLEDIFLKTPVYATEKLDGTNVALDEAGVLYGRRVVIPPDKNEYQKTSLEKVKNAEILKMKSDICNDAGIDEKDIENFIVYGELICNHFYEYDERNLFGLWTVFGARIVTQSTEKVYQQLSVKGFVVKKKGEVQEKQDVLILSNGSFAQLAKTNNMVTPNLIGDGKPIFDVVAENKEAMKTGKIEGIIFTWQTSDYGGHIMKWKGPQEYQPSAVKDLTEALKIIQEKNIEGDVKTLFKYLKEVAEADTDVNEKVKKKFKSEAHAEIRNEEQNKHKQKKQKETLDRKLIVDGTYHSMNKFDDIDTYEDIQDYTSMLVDEVRRHYFEEKSTEDNLKENDPLLEIIKETVRKIVTRKLNPKKK